ncbi:hypothetical protein PR202_ga29664 [Eleusine coracana subsp. coracana]|uniref:isopentenyl-diphosphate Delta-isomerase n=1 Tax=Eleusine coracana subsp. coracana TaxID=191504 RepID=A0AAV5DMD2_ELECO|nr:hypothetical protein PR202_ga29664 [Eleusine coracana subsp. coracana]
MEKIESENLLHRAFSVFLFNSKYELLLQQRSATKVTFPLVWTNTCCSHPLYRESELIQENYLGVRNAAQRKLLDELGIPAEDVPVDQFTPLGRMLYKAPSDGKWGEHELDYLLFIVRDVKLQPNPDEVADVKYVNREQLKELISKADAGEEGLKLSPWFRLVVDNFLMGWWDHVEKGTLNEAVDMETIHKLKDRTGNSRLLSLLHRGIVHATTNLEMEASLAGDPEQHSNKPQQEQKRKSLLAVAVGIKNKAVVHKLVTKFTASEFTVMLFHYDGAAWSSGPTSSRGRAGPSTWRSAGRPSSGSPSGSCTRTWVADYDYVFLWDEDVEVDAFDPARYLAIVRREGLEVSQPALDRASDIHHAHTAHQGGAGWVKVMVPVFSRAAWRCAWEMIQNDLVHGWGLDFKLAYCVGGDRAPARSVGAVDGEYVLHRGVAVLGDDGGKKESGRGAVRWRAFKEMQIFDTPYIYIYMLF